MLVQQRRAVGVRAGGQQVLQRLRVRAAVRALAGRVPVQPFPLPDVRRSLLIEVLPQRRHQRPAVDMTWDPAHQPASGQLRQQRSAVPGARRDHGGRACLADHREAAQQFPHRLRLRTEHLLGQVVVQPLAGVAHPLQHTGPVAGVDIAQDLDDAAGQRGPSAGALVDPFGQVGRVVGGGGPQQGRDLPGIERKLRCVYLGDHALATQSRQRERHLTS